MMLETADNWVKVVEVGPRDGLQNEPVFIDTHTKLALIERLAATGLTHIEATSFVSARWVPQLADASEVMRSLTDSTIHYSALVPNIQGLELAIAAGTREVAVFIAASEAFSNKNINCSIRQSLSRIEPIMALAGKQNIAVRGYLSCVLGCPYQGAVELAQVSALSRELIDMGCYEVSLGDTIGIGTPLQAGSLIEQVSKQLPVAQLAVHFHDSYGQALANIYAALQQGVRTVDSSIAGLGGCPYAVGASGNVATEDVLYLLQGLGFSTGVDIVKAAQCGHWISTELARPNGSKTGRAIITI